MNDGGFCEICGSIDRLTANTSVLAYRIGRPNKPMAIHLRCFDRSQYVKIARAGDAPGAGGDASTTLASGAK